MRLPSLLTLTGVALLSTQVTRASDLTWDPNGSTANQTDGAGDWLTADLWWNGTSNVSWTSADNAIFGNGGAGGAVTLASPTTVGSLTFNYFTGTYTIGTAGQAITLNSGITKNAGSQAVIITSPIILGAAQTWTNNSTTLLSTNSAAGMDNGGFTLTIDGAGNTTFTGVAGNVISGGGGLTKNGAGVLELGGAGTPQIHTYSGTTTINDGIVRINGGTYNNSTGTGNLTINGGILEGYFGGSYTRALGSGVGQIQILGGTSGFGGQGGTATTFNIGGAGATLVWGSSFFNPTIFALQATTANTNGKIILTNGIDLNGSNRTITSFQTTDGAAGSGATISGVISNSTGTAGLTKNGVGNLILTNVNTYNGATTISSEKLNGGTNGGGAITLSGAGTINTTSALNLNGTGTLRLVNTAQVDRFADGAAITSNGGTISYENTSGANVYTETLGSLGLVSGQTNIVLNTNQAGAGSQTLTLGGLTRTGTNTSAVTFSAATTGPQITGNKNMVVVTGSGTTTAGQIIGAWATTGTTAALQTDYAVYNGNYITAANITANNDETTWTSSDNINLGVTATLTAARTVNTLRYSGAAANLVLDANNLQTGGLLNGGSGLLTITSTGGALTTASGGGNLYVTTGSAGITSAAAITNNGGTVNLVKSGSGTLILSAANNTYTGNTIVNAGTLQIGVSGSAAQLNSGNYAGNIFIGAGAALTLTGNSTNTLSGNITGDGALNILRGATTLSGNNSYTGKTTIGLVTTNGVGNAVTVSSFNSVVGGTATSSLGAPTTVANGTIEFGGGVQSNAQLNYIGSGETTDRVINFNFNGSSSRIIDTSGSGLLKFTSAFTSNNVNSNVILQGSSDGEIVQGLGFSFNNFTKSGNGIWTLGGVVGSTGATTVNGGTLALRNKSSLMGGNTANWTAAKVVVNNGGTLALNVGGSGEFGSGDVTTILTNLGGLGGAINNNGLRSGSKIGFDTTNATGGTFTIGNNIANSTGTGGGAIGLTKRGTGILALTGTNTYTGATTVSAGKLAVNGSLANTAVTVQTGATLQGSGFIVGSVTIQNGGTLAAGNSIESLGTGALALNAGSTFAYELQTNLYAGTPNVAGDLTFATGNLDITAGALLTLTDLATSTALANNSILTLISYSGTWNGGLFTYNTTTLNDDSTFVLGANTWRFNYNDTLEGANYTSDSVGTFVTMTVIPEPRAALLGCLGVLLLLRRRR
ncbi:MAG: autotransporter-associated beta strand repeat-containing protein [Verrucomicrobiota bacterium]